MSERHLSKFNRGYVPCSECGTDSWTGLCSRCKTAVQHHAKTRRQHAHYCACGRPGKYINGDRSWSCKACHAIESRGYESYVGARESMQPHESTFIENN